MSDAVKPACPVCGTKNPEPIYPSALGMPVVRQALIAYRCSNGHTFLPPDEMADAASAAKQI
jgi:hypothetical protein